jgi:hypothetical protein
MDWLAWHRRYDSDSHLRRRLELVRLSLADALSAAHGRSLRLISMCAGEGRDVIPVLAAHPRGRDVAALLVEVDPRIAARARSAAAAAGLVAVRVREADAGLTSAYADFVPADVVLACGVFGNLTDEAIRTTVTSLPALCAPGATVIWTRHRRDPDVTPAIRGWFRDAGFAEVAFRAVSESPGTVGVHRLTGAPGPFAPGMRLFTFVPERQAEGPSDRRA